jgi:hypothetical protein
MYREFGRVRVIDGDELDTALHQCGDKGQVSGQTVELGDNKPCLVLLAGRQGRRELLSIAVLSCPDAAVTWRLSPTSERVLSRPCLRFVTVAQPPEDRPAGVIALVPPFRREHHGPDEASGDLHRHRAVYHGAKETDGTGEEGDFVPTRIVNQRPLVEMIAHDGDNDARNRKNDHPWASC